MLKRSLTILICSLALLLASCTGVSRAEDPGMPAGLKAWACPEYARRYFIKVEAPGDAGAAGLHGNAMFASVTLPLKLVGEAAARHSEPVALVGEDGAIQLIYARNVAGGSETEITFQTYPGQRRFCLYTDAAKAPRRFSPEQLHPAPLMVRLRGMTADNSFFPSIKSPLTLARFQQMEQERGQPLQPGRLTTNPEIQTNIDDPECPYFGVQYDIQDRISGIINPPNYAAIYEGFLRCPVAGRYNFAIDTPGAVHLVIDGVPVLSAEMPDDRRDAFALHNSIDLPEGVHRVVVHYAEANPVSERGARKTNVDLRRFGLRLHWQPPFSSGLLCIPPLAFVKFLPAVVTACEHAPASPGGVTTEAPFIHVETIGHVRVSAHKGDDSARELMLACARTRALAPGARLRISTAGEDDILGLPNQKILCAWVPAGKPVEFKIDGADDATRSILWPTLKTGLKEFVEREVMDIEAELLVKSAPEFLYPNETGHIHLETLLSPKPSIIHKTRYDARDLQGWEMLPPMPRPFGEFNVVFRESGAGVAVETSAAATPDDTRRKKLRVSFPVQWIKIRELKLQMQALVAKGDVAKGSPPAPAEMDADHDLLRKLAEQAESLLSKQADAGGNGPLQRAAHALKQAHDERTNKNVAAALKLESAAVTDLEAAEADALAGVARAAMAGTQELSLRLMVGGVECQREDFHILHARAPNWPGKLELDGGDLAFKPNTPNAVTERVVILVPHEDEAFHRRLKLDPFASGTKVTAVLFIGDPLVEGAAPAPANAPGNGLDLALAKAKPGMTWSAIETAGPHRYRPLLRMLADLDAYTQSAPGKTLPKAAVINLGSGDVARQTPLHIFERALDTLLARLTAGGVEDIVVVGAIPEPWREKQCEPYQERVNNVVKQHHVKGIDLLQMWTKDPAWMRRFNPAGEKTEITGPVPNAAAISEIVNLILSRL